MSRRLAFDSTRLALIVGEIWFGPFAAGIDPRELGPDITHHGIDVRRLFLQARELPAQDLGAAGRAHALVIILDFQRRDFAQRETERLRHADGARHLHMLGGEDLVRIGAALFAGDRRQQSASHVKADGIA